MSRKAVFLLPPRRTYRWEWEITRRFQHPDNHTGLPIFVAAFKLNYLCAIDRMLI